MGMKNGNEMRKNAIFRIYMFLASKLKVWHAKTVIQRAAVESESGGLRNVYNKSRQGQKVLTVSETNRKVY